MRYRSEVAAYTKLVLQAPDMKEARRRLDEFAERFQKTAPKAVACLEDGFDDAMAVMVLPEKYRKRLRMFGDLLAEQNEVWQSRRYLDMDEFNEWLMERSETGGPNVVAMKVG